LIDASISDPLFSAVIGTMIFTKANWYKKSMFSINIGSFFESIKKFWSKIKP
jgi:hypothetical protein